MHGVLLDEFVVRKMLKFARKCEALSHQTGAQIREGFKLKVLEYRLHAQRAAAARLRVPQ